MHIPVHTPLTQPSTPTNSTAAAPTPTQWHIPPQQVCADGACPTPVCGKYSPAPHSPPLTPPRRKDTGPFRCPRCATGYAKPQSLRRHFPACVARKGNPDCDAWTDDDSYAVEMAGREAREGSRRVWHVALTACELAIRAGTHCGWGIRPLERADGVEVG